MLSPAANTALSVRIVIAWNHIIILQLWIEPRGGPVGVLAGQEAAVVRLVNLGVDQCIHFVVHCQQQLAVLLRVDSKVLHLVRIRLEIEQLDVVQLEDALQGKRLVVLFGREVSAVLVAPVEHTADGSPLGEIRLEALRRDVFLLPPGIQDGSARRKGSTTNSPAEIQRVIPKIGCRRS